MATVLLVLHIMIATALVGVVLLQRAEAGGLVSGGGGGFLSGRGTANLMTRTTSILAALFFLTSILLTALAQQGTSSRSLFEDRAPSGKTEPAPSAPGAIAPPVPSTGPAPGPRGGLLDELEKGGNQRLPQLPATR
jgi:preprotein translocase subunit SecG